MAGGGEAKVEVAVRHMGGDVFWRGSVQRGLAVEAFLRQLGAPSSCLLAGTAIVSGDATAEELVELAEGAGDKGEAVVTLVATGLEIGESQHRLHARDPADANAPPIEIFTAELPSWSEDTILAKFNEGLSEALGMCCRLADLSKWGVYGPALLEVEDEPQGYSDAGNLGVVVEGRPEPLVATVQYGQIVSARLVQELALEFGPQNPTRCYTSAKVLQRHVPHFARVDWNSLTVFDGAWPHASKPLWKPHKRRIMVSRAELDDGRVLLSGGEYEDYYDPEFCIFNDILVKYPDRRAPELYVYPREVFPPTGGHASLQVGDHLYLLGCVGYATERRAAMQVLRVDLRSYSVKRLEVPGPCPPWCSIREMPVSGSDGCWERGAAGCHPFWTPPPDLRLPVDFRFANGRAEAHVAGLLFGIVVKTGTFEDGSDYEVAEAEMPRGPRVVTAGDLTTINSDTLLQRFIVAHLDDGLGVAYLSAHNIKEGMYFDLDADSAEANAGAADAAAPFKQRVCGLVRRFSEVRVRRADGSLFGLARLRLDRCETTGLQHCEQSLPHVGLRGRLDSVAPAPARRVDRENVEDVGQEAVAYRPLPLFLAEAAVRQAELHGSSKGGVEAARAALAKVAEEVQVMARAEEELMEAALCTDVDAQARARAKWGLGGGRGNPRLEGGDIIVDVQLPGELGQQRWRLSVGAEPLRWCREG